MQVTDPALANDIANAPPAGTPGLPPRLSVALLRDLAASASLLGGKHATHAVIAPFTGRKVIDVWLGAEEDMRAAVARARRAQPAWASRPVATRARMLLRLHDIIFERIQEGMDLLQLEAGKSRIDAFIEIMDVAVVARYYALHGEGLLKRRTRPGFIPVLTRSSVGYHPKGVVGVIAPWNYPFTMAISDALPALLAGNSVVIKPAEATPLTALWAARLLYEAGLPSEVLHVVPGHGSEIGPVLIDEVDFVQFTGSTEVGRRVSEQAGRRLIGTSLELGGKNPLIVREDVDLRRAIPGILQACYSCAGQLCISAERVYVHHARYSEFVEALTAAVGAMVINDRYDFSGHMGSLVSQEQLDKVTEHVEDARQRGARVLAGGFVMPEVGPFFYAPTVLEGVSDGMKLYREETFGPVVALYPFADDAEAVALANDSDYGLHASVWSRDVIAAHAVAEQLQCGTVSVNDAYVATWGSSSSPMGGFKASGLGRRHGPEGLLKFTEPQTVAVQLLGPLTPSTFGLRQEAFVGATSAALRFIKQIPGLR